MGVGHSSIRPLCCTSTCTMSEQVSMIMSRTPGTSSKTTMVRFNAIETRVAATAVKAHELFVAMCIFLYH
eukprot:SAG31_NODE_212_length_20157_cov_9.648868_8_plen_70_part_00